MKRSWRKRRSLEEIQGRGVRGRIRKAVNVSTDKLYSL